MNDLISILKSDINKLVLDLENQKIINNFNINSINIDHSSKSRTADLSTNVLIILLKKNLDKSFNLKEYVNSYFKNLKYIEGIEIVNPGFVNISIKKQFLYSKLKEIFNNKHNFFSAPKKNKINIEFVSANPTGPIHVAHMRGAVIGDVLSSIFNAIGYSVTREYYVNDAGSQIITLGNSLFKRYLELFNIKVDLLDGEYPGEYLIEIAHEIKKNDSDKWIKYQNIDERNKYFQSIAVNFLINKIKSDLSLINVSFDKFTFESEIIKKKLLSKVFSLLEEKKLIYEGVLDKPLGDDDKNWEPRKQLLFRSTKFNDDFDRPFKKANGDWTYFANDSAYHYDKFTRGYDNLINIWGADHIGYVSRMKSIVDVISNKKNYLEICICQIVRLIKNGNLLKMSKREGNFITLKEIHKTVGKDALRYFMISSKSETPMDFDMDKVVEKNKDNPVFYCQYAYARTSSVLRKAKELNILPEIDNMLDLFDINKISSFEWDIILKMLAWPYILKKSAETKQPHRITNYLESLCSEFHSFWNKGKDDASLRMIDEKNINNTITKIIWLICFKKTLGEIFNIIGIEAPKSM